MVTVLAGIDPGLHGALAVLNEAGDCETILMPIMGEPPIVDGGAVVRWFAERDVELAIVELAHAMPAFRTKGGKEVKQGISSTFRLGQAYGQILGVLQACCIPYKLVAAKRWKTAFSLHTDKAESIRRAIELMPRARDQFLRRKDEARAEAALIAWWYMHERPIRGDDR